MGSIKDQLYEQNEENANEALAIVLGITPDEASQLEYGTPNEIGTEDGIITAYEYTFSKNSPKEILAKIKGLDDDNRIQIDPSELANAMNQNDGDY